MKRKTLLFLLLLAFFAPWAAQAQETVEIGTDGGTEINQYLPAYTLYNNTISEQIYTAEEVTMAGTITSISFYNGGDTKTPEIKLYLVNTDKSEFTSTTDWITVTSDNLVFDGTVTFTANEWTTIELNNSFEYDGRSNLGLIVDEHMQWSSGLKCRVFTSTDNCSLYHYDDNVNFDATNPASGQYSGRVGVKNQLKLEITPVQQGGDVCEKPATCEVSNVTGTSATLTWSGGSGTYNVEVKGGSYTDWTPVLEGTTLTTTQLSLQATTTYQARVQSVCTGDTPTSGWKTSSSFTTPCDTYSIPYTYGFEETAPFACWTVISGNVSRQSGTTNNGTYRLDFRGTTSNMIALPQFRGATNNLRVEFYTRPESTGGSSGKFAIGYMTDITDASTFVAVATYNSTEMTTSYVKKAVDFNNAPAGANIAMRQFDCSTNYYWYVDDVTVKEVPSCLAPTSLAADASTDYAELSWIANSNEREWTVYYKKTTDENYTEVPNVNENPYPLRDLTAATNYQYYVVANCSADDSSEPSEVFTFATACDAITTFPWSEDFEDYAEGNFSHPCWVNEHISGSGSYIFKVNTLATGTNATNQLQLPDQSDGTLTKLRLPEMTLPGIDYQFVIDVYRSSSYEAKTGEGIRVYASTNGEIEGATELAFIPRYFGVANGVIPAETSGNIWYTYSLPIGFSGTCYIILRGENQYGTSTFIDNFIVERIPSCLKPTHLAVTQNSVSAHGATITWTAGDEETDWIVEYANNADFNNASTEPVENGEPTYTFQGLTAETTYYVHVMADCGDTDGVSQPSDVVSFTTTAACLAPTGLTCTAVTASTATLSWTENGESTAWQICLNDDETNPIAAATNPFTVEQLTAETVYTAKVRGICNGNNTDWSSTVSFEPSAKTVIGSGNSTNSSLPTNTYYYNSLTEQIYTVEELGEGGFIESIDFYYNGAERTRHIDVYMVSTDKNQFADNTEWIAVTENDLVFHGDVTWLQNAWTTITLDDPFLYDGTQNVAIIVDDSQNSTWESSTRTFRVFEATKQSLYISSDGTDYDPTNPSDGTVGNVKNQIRLLKSPLPSCLAPMHVTVTEVTPSGVTIAWDKKATEETGNITYDAICVAHGTTPDWTSAGVIYVFDRYTNENQPKVMFSQLESETEYDYYIRRDCGNGDYSEEVTGSFTTLEGCPAPTNVEVSNITHTSAHVAWTGYSDSYNVYLGTEGEPTTLLGVNFDDQTIPATWTNDATHPWVTAAHGDGYCMQSTIQGLSNTTTAITATVTYPGNGTISFDLWSRGEGSDSYNWDKSRFYIDDVMYIDYGEHSDWESFSTNVSVGTHTFKWEYKKDGSTDKDGDYFAVDNIVMTYKDVVWGEPVSVETAEHTFNTLTPGTDYFVKVQGFCDETPSEESEMVTFNAPAYKHFVTEGEWNVAANWEPEGLPETGDDVFVDAPATIPANYLANVGHVTLGTNGAITIKDGGQLRHTNVNTDGVTVTLEKVINAYPDANVKSGYYFIAPAPFIQTILPNSVENLKSNNYDFYSFNAAAEDGLEWRNLHNSNTSLKSAHGYLYANSGDGENATVTLKSTGLALSATSGGASLSIQYDPNDDYEFNGWELAGNPYVCNGYVYVENSNHNIIETDFYRMNEDGDGYDMISSTDPIKPYEGVFVYIEGEQGQRGIRFSPDPIESSNGSKLNMNLSNNGRRVDMARMRFGQGQNLAKMSFRENSSKLFIPQNGKDYAMVYTEEQGVMPVNFKAEDNGSYTLSFTSEEVSFAYLHLIDNLTGIETDLLANPSYSFEARTTDYESRFKLVFATGNNADSDTFAFFSNGSFVINNEGEATLQVIDVNGRILKSESINGCANVNVKAAAGVYMLRLVNGDNVKVQKVVVR